MSYPADEPMYPIGNMRSHHTGVQLLNVPDREHQRCGVPSQTPDYSGQLQVSYFDQFAEAIALALVHEDGKRGLPLTNIAMLGPVLRRQRMRVGLSQLDLAKRAGVGRRFVIDLEDGKNTVRAAEMLAVCDAAGLTFRMFKS